MDVKIQEKLNAFNPNPDKFCTATKGVRISGGNLYETSNLGGGSS